MANPTLPAKFNLGSYLGEQAAGPLRQGLQKHIGEAYESKIIENAFRDLDPNSTPEEKYQKFLSLPISDQAKKHGLQLFKEQQKNAPSLENSYKSIHSAVSQHEGLKDLFASLPFEDQRALAGEVLKRGGDRAATDSVLSEYLSSPDKIPGINRTAQGKGDVTTKFNRFGTRALEKAWRTSKLGKIFGAGDPEKLQQLAEKDPAAYNDWISSNVGPLLLDFPLYAAAFQTLGPIGGMASVEGLAEGADRTWALARKKAKGEEITPEEYNEAAASTVQQALKGSLFGAFAKLMPVQKLIQSVPGGRKLLQNSFAQGAAQIAEAGLVAPEAASILAEGKIQESPDRLRNLLLALGFKGISSLGRGQNGASPEQPSAPRPPVRPNQGQQLLEAPQAPIELGQARPPDPLQQMVDSARTGEDVLQSRRTAQKARSVGATTPNSAIQEAQASASQPGTEAVGNVSVPLAPQEQLEAHRPSRVQPKNQVQRGILQDANAISQLTGRATPAPVGENPRLAQVPRPQGIPELEPLAREQRVGQMRGERPFLPEGEGKVSGHQKTETIQKHEAKSAELAKEIGKLRDQVKELNKLEKERSTLPKEERESLDGKISKLKEEIEAQKKLARKIQKEIQTGREKLSDKSITEAVAKRRTKLIEEAGKQTSKSDKDVAKTQIRAKALEAKLKEAKQLARKADHLPAEYKDSFLRVKNRYVEEFSRIRDAAKREMNLSEEGSQEHRVAKRIHDEADSIVKEAEADITKHRHKKGQEHKAEKEKTEGQIKEREKTSKRTEKITPKRFNEFRKSLEAYQSKKDSASLNNLVKSLDMEPQTVKRVEQEATKMGRDFAKRHFEHIKAKPKAEGSKGPIAEEPKAKEQPKAKQTKEKTGGSGEEFEEAIKKSRGEEKANPKESMPSKGDYFRYVLHQAKKLGEHLRSGNLKEAWKNPLGRSLIVQSAVVAFDEYLKENDITGFPIGSLATGFIGSGGIPGIAVRAASNFIVRSAKALIKNVSNSSLVSQYNQALKNHDLEKIRELDSKLTPKLKKKAKEQRLK